MNWQRFFPFIKIHIQRPRRPKNREARASPEGSERKVNRTDKLERESTLSLTPAASSPPTETGLRKGEREHSQRRVEPCWNAFRLISRNIIYRPSCPFLAAAAVHAPPSPPSLSLSLALACVSEYLLARGGRADYVCMCVYVYVWKCVGAAAGVCGFLKSSGEISYIQDRRRRD